MTPSLPKLGYFLRPISTSSTIKNTVSMEPLDGLYPAFSASGQDVWTPYFDFEGDALILSAVGAQSGKTFEATGRWGCVANTTGFALCRDANRRFFWYLTNLPNFWERGGAAQPYVKVSESLRLRIDLPSPEKQRAIAAFLDEKCAKVDEAVRIKEEQIALLRERRQILIQQAVTRGLNPAAPMKDSGIDWIGQIPAHWDVENPKWLFNHRKERARKGEPQLAATQKYGVIPQSDFMDLEGRRITQVFLDFDILKHVEAGDFVMSMRSFQGGLEYSEYTGCVSSAYVALEPGPRIFAPFFKYLFKSARYIEALQATSNLVRDGQALRFDNFTMVILPVVPLDEQRAIAEYLDHELAKSDQGIAVKEEQIAALKEYKTSLINAAVTGKIKVNR